MSLRTLGKSNNFQCCHFPSCHLKVITPTPTHSERKYNSPWLREGLSAQLQVIITAGDSSCYPTLTVFSEIPPQHSTEFMEILNYLPNVLFMGKTPKIPFFSEHRSNLLKTQWGSAVWTWTKRWIFPLQPFYNNKKDKIFVGKEHDFIFYLISKSLMHFRKNLNITCIMIH